MPNQASSCSANTEDIFPQPADGSKYRYFNQPIEQIPGYAEGSPQLLVHRPNGGLQWATMDQCLDVVTCIKLESSELTIERRKIVVIKDFEAETADCPPVEVTECSGTGT